MAAKKPIEYTFTLEEIRKMNKFRKKHKACGASTLIVISSSSSGIGTSTTLKCPTCMTEKDITDYASW